MCLTLLACLSHEALAGDSATERLARLIMPVTPVMQAELDVIPSPEQALKQARNYRGNGELGRARITALHGLYLADPGSDIHRQLLDEIDFELPTIQIKQWLFDGRLVDAERSLERLARRYRNDDGKTARIDSLRGGVVSARRLRTMRETDEQKVIEDVRRVMRAYYREHGYYPQNYRALNAVLPTGHAALQNFEVIRFQPGLSGGYQMVLRNRDNHRNQVTISATGLIR